MANTVQYVNSEATFLLAILPFLFQCTFARLQYLDDVIEYDKQDSKENIGTDFTHIHFHCNTLHKAAFELLSYKEQQETK